MVVERCTTISVIESLGDGSGTVTARDVEIDEFAVCLVRPLENIPGEPEPGFDSGDGSGPIERLWIAPGELDGYVTVWPADSVGVDDADIVVVISELPVPNDFQNTPPGELRVEVRVESLAPQPSY